MQQDNIFWDKLAASSEKEEVRSDYLRNLFLRAIKLGLKYIPKDRLNLLKVDLWNEGIDKKRDILNHLPRSLNFFGMDVSYEVCKSAQNPDIAVSQADLKALPFKEDSFNIILDLSTSDHIPPAKLPVIIKEYTRILRSEGILIFIFDRWGLIWQLYMAYLRHVRKQTSPIDKTRFMFPLPFVKNLILNNNLKIKSEFSIDYTGWTWNRITKPIWQRLPLKIYNLVLNLEYSPISKYLTILGKQYVLIVKKD